MFSQPNIKKRTSGRLASVRYANELADAIIGMQPLLQSGALPPALIARTNPQFIVAKNNSGSDLDKYAVLGVDAAGFYGTLDPELPIAVIGVAPVIATHAGKFLVLAESLKNGETGLAVIGGTFWAKVNITSSGDTFADVQASTLELKTGTSGAAQILWKESGTGTGKYAIVRIGGGGGSGSSGQWFKIKTDASGGIAVCNTWDGTTAGSDDINVKVVTKLKAGETLFAHQYAGYTVAPWREAAPDGCQFPVKLTQTSGSAGSKTTKCSFTYTVKDPSNTYTYATGVTPEGQADYNNRKRKAATFGWAYLDAGGALKLLCNEEHGSGAC